MPTPTKKKGKILRKLFFLLLGSLLTYTFVTSNLEFHSIYYEEQLASSEKERRDNVIKATIINLRILYDEDIPNMRFDFDGTNFVENQNDSSTKYYPGISWNGGSYTYFDRKRNSYVFDNKLNLIQGVNSTEYKILDVTQLNEEQLKDEMYETIKPIIDAQTQTPLLNLLWLYKLVRK